MTSTARVEPAVHSRAFIVVAALLLFGSAAITITWCGSMSAMPGMDMPGGWSMSMAWMRMPGQTWTGATATFLGMWTVMMIAMMLPVLMPLLSRYRCAVNAPGVRLGRLTAIVGLGYFGVWTLLGALAFPLGVALAATEMSLPALSRAVPIIAGLALTASGVLQLTQWKARQLACCRQSGLRALPANAGAAWRHGLRLGLRCCHCCAPLTAVLLVAGVMDLRAMALVTAAILAERLLPGGRRVARVIGLAMCAAGAIYSIACATAGLDSNWPIL